MKLRKGDTIRVVCPSMAHGILSHETIKEAVRVLTEEFGLIVTFGRGTSESVDPLTCSTSLASRLDDLDEAFRDPSVKAILTSIGGFNSNQLLPHLDYELIRQNPKILCGYSDITALQVAIYSQTGLTTYSGPHFSTFGMKRGNEYCKAAFKKFFMEGDSDKILIKPSPEFSVDAWYLDQDARIFLPNDGHLVIQGGSCEGTLFGGNLSTLVALLGTPFLPMNFDGPVVLFLEDDELARGDTPFVFERSLTSLCQALIKPGSVAGLVIGRFHPDCGMSKANIAGIVGRLFPGVPCLANADFGHTSPIGIIPLAGKARMSCGPSQQSELYITH